MTDPLEIHPRPHWHPESGIVEVWHGSDRLWRYRFLHPTGMDIRSNRSFLTREEADESAMLAYPGVSIVELSEPPFAGPKAHPWRNLATLSIVTGGVGLVVIGLTKLLLFVRRVARRGKQIVEWIGIAIDLFRRER